MEKKEKAVKKIPEGYHNVTPMLVVKDASGVLDFLKNVFDAKERYRMTDPNGDIMHAEVTIGDSAVMIGEANEKRGPMPAGIYLYVDNADITYKKALEAGGTSVMQLEDQFYGDRSGSVKDPGGNIWWIATHIEDVSEEEMHKREEKFMKEKH